jgi:hypothetical protein
MLINRQKFIYYGLIVLLVLYLLKTIIPNLQIGPPEMLVLLLCSLVTSFRYYVNRTALYYYILYLVIVVISTIINFEEYSLTFSETFLQFIINLKIILLFFIAGTFLAMKNELTISKLLKLIKFVLFVSFVFCILQMFFIQEFIKFFPGVNLNSFVKDTSFRRYTGIFFHPTPLSYFCSLSLIFIIAKKKLMARLEFYTLIIITASLMFLSGQRGEVFFLLVALLLTFIFLKLTTGSIKIKSIIFSIGFSFILIIALLYSRTIIIDGDVIARMTIYNGSANLAEMFFPFGGGLSTFGSSQSGNSVLYDILGISSLWWFISEQNYLTDTFWAMILGESGWFGMIFYISFITMSLFSLIDKRKSKYQVWAVFFILLESTTNPIFTGAAFLAIYALIIVIFSGDEVGKKS